MPRRLWSQVDLTHSAYSFSGVGNEPFRNLVCHRELHAPFKRTWEGVTSPERAISIEIREGSVGVRRPRRGASRRPGTVPVGVVHDVHHAYTTEDVWPVVAGCS